ncbi:hypothetical protein [Tessaracoccus defluvii]|uniref:Uncharacterized protein n=1 Tax=Tessaracoccus defluvii TaxID=1285901 RepID=A0A7H0H7D9_9ACTN|nr:hypothetical protein [Tessaracoccus defluvii]QNP56455.1 hypothetical protein H9L22_03185 [Tessaracoccus defluvii]
MLNRMNRIILAGLSGVLVLTLGACGSAQSTADACKIAQETVEKASADIPTTLASAGTGDYAAMKDAFTTLASSIGDAETKVTNAEVKSALGEFKTGISEFGALFDGLTDGDINALAELSGDLETASTKLSTSGENLTKLCSA